MSDTEHASVRHGSTLRGSARRGSPALDRGGHDEDHAARLRAWLAEGRAAVQSCLARERVAHGGVSTAPVWAAVPMLAVWPVRIATARDTVGWWAVSGDVPTDYVAARDVPDARHALAAFAARWHQAAEQMAGAAAPSADEPADLRTLSALLRGRADALARWAGDASVWRSRGRGD
jgi:hypothetical protein